ncbi:hypothetical protein CPC08DRAFT_461361 [Agrocybe pediades]|nr:hypothetical protein CPC08DRAFT_461361 [Agrocybe pediades]
MPFCIFIVPICTQIDIHHHHHPLIHHLFFSFLYRPFPFFLSCSPVFDSSIIHSSIRLQYLHRFGILFYLICMSLTTTHYSWLSFTPDTDNPHFYPALYCNDQFIACCLFFLF